MNHKSYIIIAVLVVLSCSEKKESLSLSSTEERLKNNNPFLTEKELKQRMDNLILPRVLGNEMPALTILHSISSRAKLNFCDENPELAPYRFPIDDTAVKNLDLIISIDLKNKNLSACLTEFCAITNLKWNIKNGKILIEEK